MKTKKVFDLVTKSNKAIKDVSEEVTKALTVTSSKNNKAVENLNNKLREIKNDRGILACYLMSPLSKITNSENTSQIKLLKDSSSYRVNDSLLHISISITL